MIPEVKELIDRFDQLDYVVEEELATVLFFNVEAEKTFTFGRPPWGWENRGGKYYCPLSGS